MLSTQEAILFYVEINFAGDIAAELRNKEKVVLPPAPTHSQEILDRHQAQLAVLTEKAESAQLERMQKRDRLLDQLDADPDNYDLQYNLSEVELEISQEKIDALHRGLRVQLRYRGD